MLYAATFGRLRMLEVHRSMPLAVLWYETLTSGQGRRIDMVGFMNVICAHVHTEVPVHLRYVGG